VEGANSDKPANLLFNYSPQKFRIANKSEAWGLMLWNFYGHNLQMFICKLLEFFPGKPFQPSLVFVGMANGLL
jgi:hypothetical protein